MIPQTLSCRLSLDITDSENTLKKMMMRIAYCTAASTALVNKMFLLMEKRGEFWSCVTQILLVHKHFHLRL